MSVMPLEVMVAFVSVGGGVLMWLGLIILRLTLTRRVKKELKPKGEYWESGTLDFGLLNTGLFAWACVLPYMQRSKMFQNLYPGMNVKKHMTWFEKMSAYAAIGGLLVALLFGVIFVIVEP